MSKQIGQKTMKNCLSLVLVVVALIIPACSTVLVDSNPPGAKILIDGEDTGKVTPAGLRVKDIGSGYRSIELQKEGFAPSYKSLLVRINPGKVFLSLFPPLSLKFGFGDCWKTARPRAISLTLNPNESPQNNNE
jgi:hypothetical protein